MTGALLYKEWIKTRQALAVTVAVFAAFAIYSYIGMSQDFRISGAVAVWANVIMKDADIIPGMFRWFPLIAGILLAVVQFSPEMASKRLKLTMHLPMPETRIMVTMTAYGFTVLLLLNILAGGVFAAQAAMSYPAEIVEALISKLAPWCVAGLSAYLLAVWVCVEPTWRQRVANTVAAVFALSALFLSSGSWAYIKFMLLLIAAIALSFLFPLYSAARFKDGAQ